MNQGKLEAVKQEMTRVNSDILGISKLNEWMGEWWMGEWENVTPMAITSTTMGKIPLEEME